MSLHLAEHIFPCQECDKVFSCKSHHEDHIKIHICKYIFSCQECGKKFALKSNRDLHMRLHSDRKHLSCKNCNGTFSEKGLLELHLETHKCETNQSHDQLFHNVPNETVPLNTDRTHSFLVKEEEEDY